MTDEEMVGWHHRLNRREFGQALGDDDKVQTPVLWPPHVKS